MKDLVEYIAKSLVDEPDSVEVTEQVEDEASVIRLKVSKDDLGKVIGKKGRTAKAMRTLLAAVATRDEKRSTLEIVE
ncbi:MAG: KH domain-containing protein [Myxococcota bacterium]|nr:KH domain-containing protein [Myxococcota bacterium]